VKGNSAVENTFTLPLIAQYNQLCADVQSSIGIEQTKQLVLSNAT